MPDMERLKVSNKPAFDTALIKLLKKHKIITDDEQVTTLQVARYMNRRGDKRVGLTLAVTESENEDG